MRLGLKRATAMVWPVAMALTVASAMAPAPSVAQPIDAPAAGPQIRPLVLSALTGYEIEQYLKRNDVVFAPVGPTEMHGGLPTDANVAAFDVVSMLDALKDEARFVKTLKSRYGALPPPGPELPADRHWQPRPRSFRRQADVGSGRKSTRTPCA